jgi:erythromycin esterase-like protein
VNLLRNVQAHVQGLIPEDDEAFDAAQNAFIAVNAEAYYRAMVRGDRTSWNIRDNHMADTIDFLSRQFGESARGVIWEHNTHIGDARATDMADHGLVNVGQLVRDRHAKDGVALIGFASHHGTVLAGSSWGSPEEVMTLPAAQTGSHEDLLHRALAHDAILDFTRPRTGEWSSSRRGHRAVGVVYNPENESGNYVATQMDARYDALLWCDETSALEPLRHEPTPNEREFETEPTGL